ncbi:sulfite exporter TauE/SafE family protein [Flavobacterium sp. HXWNR69]|uniref:Probable membrane transporter protein n=1 Tax=Flavobacterium fragile TaxID=2949085 RepID=A0ABT0TE54_9FLAO|nr:sulfite exporter TauE/SafE family protein [Flavobacterium sp. HXWNR69]MCL9769253.1 sulfite exporter TauE/SafE family protein [Flavobacterium sp. HXWNR69]
MDFQVILSLMVIGILAGILSGLVGVGGGVVMVPMLVLLLGFTQHQAQGTSLAVLVVPVTAVAVYNYYKEGHIDWRYAAVIAMFFVVGGYFGSKIAIGLDQKVLKKVFGFILLFIAGKMLIGK